MKGINDYEGRITGLEMFYNLFWITLLTLIPTAILLAALEALNNQQVYPMEKGIPFIAGLIFIWLCIIQIIKRLHDLNISGYLSILAFIPLINIILILILSVIPGKKQDNKYGTPPVKISGKKRIGAILATTSLFLLFPTMFILNVKSQTYSTDFHECTYNIINTCTSNVIYDILKETNAPLSSKREIQDELVRINKQDVHPQKSALIESLSLRDIVTYLENKGLSIQPLIIRVKSPAELAKDLRSINSIVLYNTLNFADANYGVIYKIEGDNVELFDSFIGRKTIPISELYKIINSPNTNPAILSITNN